MPRAEGFRNPEWRYDWKTRSARVIAEGKVRTYDMSANGTDSPWRGWQGLNARRRERDRRLRQLNRHFINVAPLQFGED